MFHPCKCVTRKLYSEAEEAAINIEFGNFKTVVDRLATAPKFSDIGWLIDLLGGMNPNTRRMTKTWCNNVVYENICHLVSRVRRMTVKEYSDGGGANLELYRRVKNLRPKIAVLINYDECVYKETASMFCTIQPTQHGICQKHIMMIYIAHCELTENMHSNLVKICLDYLLVGYEEVPGCVPILSRAIVKRKRDL